jgi:uncharacterized protein YlxW (UPF0749 family)
MSERRSSDFLVDLFRHPLDPGYVEAARRRSGAPPVAGWRRRGAVGGRALVFVVIGFLLTIAYEYAVAAKPETTKARAGLVADVRERRAQTEQMQRHADEVRQQVNRDRDRALAGTGAESGRLRDLEAITGLGEVRGDGVSVRLADAPAPVDPVTGKPSGSNPGLVLDRDLQDVVNELWRDGAEAIAINGQRLTATTTIRAAGGAILVDFRPISGPYQVSAIGPDDIDKRFTASATGRRFHRYVDAYHMQFTIKRETGMTLPAAAEPRLRFARPPASPSASPARPAATSPVPSPSGGGR